MEDVVASSVLSAALEGEDILRMLDDDDDGAVAAAICADGARIGAREVTTLLTLSHFCDERLQRVGDAWYGSIWRP